MVWIMQRLCEYIGVDSAEALAIRNALWFSKDCMLRGIVESDSKRMLLLGWLAK